jgi:cyclohexyl-isocyanide hydratase
MSTDIAFLAYDEMTALDLVGVFDAVTRLGTMDITPVDWDVLARTPRATATGDLRFEPTAVGTPPGEYDVVVVPGGTGTRRLLDDDAMVEWVRTAADCDLITSVCTGSLLLGAAGLLDGRRATTHPSAYDTLAAYCTVVEERVVRDGDCITARGVSSSIDLGLELVETLADADARERIRRRMDYPHDSRRDIAGD